MPQYIELRKKKRKSVQQFTQLMVIQMIKLWKSAKSKRNIVMQCKDVKCYEIEN